MKYLSEYMKYVKKSEEIKLSQMFQFFLVFYGAFLMLISFYNWLIVYKFTERILLFSVIGALFTLSGLVWNYSMKKSEDYQKLKEFDKKRFYSELME